MKELTIKETNLVSGGAHSNIIGSDGMNAFNDKMDEIIKNDHGIAALIAIKWKVVGNAVAKAHDAFWSAVGK